MEKFEKLFNSKSLNDFVERTYILLDNTKDFKDMPRMRKEVDTLIQNIPDFNEKDIQPFLGVFGLPGAGKTTLAQESGKESISTDAFVAELREKNPDFPKPVHNDTFRKHEYKVISCLILSGLAKDKIIDYSGSALLQPGLAALSQRVLDDRFINLSVDTEERHKNLIKDTLNGGLHRNRLRQGVENLHISKEELDDLKKSFLQLRAENKTLNEIREKLSTRLGKKTKFGALCDICTEFDASNTWRQEVFNRVSKPMSFKEAKDKIRSL